MPGRFSCVYLVTVFCICIVPAVAIPFPGVDSPVTDLVRYYCRHLYTCDEICGFLFFIHGLDISVSTIKRIKRLLNLQRKARESPLQDVVSSILRLSYDGYSNSGYRSIWRLLSTRFNLTVTQKTVGIALKIIDPTGVDIRARRRLRRRQYINAGPNYMVHIDGYDKLKPYGIAIHGAIDGFSRKILWLKAGPSNNNPLYIARFYLDYIQQISGVPRVVRADGGSENVLVKDLQISFRFDHGDEMSRGKSFLVGRSTANQRIERLWGSLRSYFTQFWRDFFRDLQDQGIFNNADQLHIECIRFCFLPIVQAHLDTFKDNWNNHRIRSQRHSHNPCGIPNVLYYQPELFESRDYSFPLPCDAATLQQISHENSSGYPIRGCSSDFLELVHLVTGFTVDTFPEPLTAPLAKELFCAIIANVSFP